MAPSQLRSALHVDGCSGSKSLGPPSLHPTVPLPPARQTRRADEPPGGLGRRGEGWRRGSRAGGSAALCTGGLPSGLRLGRIESFPLGLATQRCLKGSPSSRRRTAPLARRLPLVNHQPASWARCPTPRPPTRTPPHSTPPLSLQLEADRMSLRLVQKLLATERHARVLEVASTLHNMPALEGALKLANHHRSAPPLGGRALWACQKPFLIKPLAAGAAGRSGLTPGRATTGSHGHPPFCSWDGVLVSCSKSPHSECNACHCHLWSAACCTADSLSAWLPLQGHCPGGAHCRLH